MITCSMLEVGRYQTKASAVREENFWDHLKSFKKSSQGLFWGMWDKIQVYNNEEQLNTMPFLFSFLVCKQ